MTSESEKDCPFCAERIPTKAVKCRFCRSMLDTPPPGPKADANPAAPGTAPERQQTDRIPHAPPLLGEPSNELPHKQKTRRAALEWPAGPSTRQRRMITGTAVIAALALVGQFIVFNHVGPALFASSDRNFPPQLMLDGVDHLNLEVLQSRFGQPQVIERPPSFEDRNWDQTFPNSDGATLAEVRYKYFPSDLTVIATVKRKRYASKLVSIVFLPGGTFTMFNILATHHGFWSARHKDKFMYNWKLSEADGTVVYESPPGLKNFMSDFFPWVKRFDSIEIDCAVPA